MSRSRVFVSHDDGAYRCGSCIPEEKEPGCTPYPWELVMANDELEAPPRCEVCGRLHDYMVTARVAEESSSVLERIACAFETHNVLLERLTDNVERFRRNQRQ